MRALGRVLGPAARLVQFFPLSVFAAYAFRHGAPTNDRWIGAFELAAAAALVQLAVLLSRRRPTNRLILGANLYLLVGGAAAFGQQWWLLQAYAALGESAIFLFMLAVGVATTLGTAGGFVAAEGAPPEAVRRASRWLLAATGGAVIVAVVFRGDRMWAAVAPVIALAVLQRVLTSRLTTAARPAGPLVRRVAWVALAVAGGGLVSRAIVGLAAPESAGVYDERDLSRVDYSGLPAPRRLTARDGTALAFRVYEAAGDTVVLAIHGSSGRGRYFHPLATYLSERAGVTVYALDLRGHGESGGRRGDVDYIGQLEDDLADVLKTIRGERPGARIVLLGHSAGGGLAVRYAGRGAPPAVDGYVLLAPYLGPDAPTTKADAGGWVRADLPKIRELSERAARGDASGQEAVVLRFNQHGGPRRGPPMPPDARSDPGNPGRSSKYARATVAVLPEVSHLGLVVHPRTAEAIAAWLGRRP